MEIKKGSSCTAANSESTTRVTAAHVVDALPSWKTDVQKQSFDFYTKKTTR